MAGAMSPEEPIFLVSLGRCWVPKHPLYHPVTKQVVRYRNGYIDRPGVVFPALGRLRAMAEEYRCPRAAMFHDPERQAEAEKREAAEAAKAKKDGLPPPRPRTGKPAKAEEVVDLPGAGPTVAGGGGAWGGSDPLVTTGGFAESGGPAITRRASDVDVGG